MMKKIRKFMAWILVCSSLFCTAGASLMPQNTESDTFAAVNEVSVDAEIDLDTYENRLMSDELAAKSDEEILEETLADPTVSEEVKEQLLLKEQLYRDALESLENGYSRRATSYFVDVEPIMQEDGTKCGPATIQMVLNHNNISYDNQSSIQKAITGDNDNDNDNDNGRKGTDLSRIMSYLNARQTNRYERRTYKNEKQLLAFLDVASQFDLPVIHTAKVGSRDVKNGRWPYTTGGHFFILCGRDSYGDYVVSDPYYYPKYVSGVKENGRHERSFDDLFTVSTNYGNTDADGNPVGYIGY